MTNDNCPRTRNLAACSAWGKNIRKEEEKKIPNLLQSSAEAPDSVSFIEGGSGYESVGEIDSHLYLRAPVAELHNRFDAKPLKLHSR
ncbi:MAG: hypothetical protein JWM11_386 [Planctomycetaceae bacterium]|nr:hypothetical protein [Planctomycetaceae bacterium]